MKTCEAVRPTVKCKRCGATFAYLPGLTCPRCGEPFCLSDCSSCRAAHHCPLASIGAKKNAAG